MGDLLSVLLDPEGLEKLISQPMGSADAGLDGILPLIHVYRYLEGNSLWKIIGDDIQENRFKLRKMIKDGKPYSICLSVIYWFPTKWLCF